jgi:hypothetical protein
MELSKSNKVSRLKAHAFLNKETQNKLTKRVLNPSHISPKHTKVDSTSTTIENQKISNTLNNEILSHKLRAYSYKRAESELRQILKKPSIIRERSEEMKKKTSLFRTSNSILRPDIRYNSSIKSREADLIISEYKSITNARVWESFLDNLRANPKHLLDLIPISLTTKNSKTSRGRLNSKLSKTNKSLKESRLQEVNFQTLNKKEVSCGQTPDIVESLKENRVNLTEDWSKSQLHFNLKHNKGKIDIKPGLSKEEIEKILTSTPSDKQDLEQILEKLFFTVEKLLIELLGTQDDLDKFHEVYEGSTPSIIRALSVKCLDLYKFREKTLEILNKIVNREKVVISLKKGSENKRSVIKLHKLSKKIRELINLWLQDDCVPFSKFIYKGQDYVEKMSKDLVNLQNVLISNS